MVVKREYIFVCILSKRALKTLESAFLLAWGLLNRGSVKSQPIKKLTSLPAVREPWRLPRYALHTLAAGFFQGVAGDKMTTINYADKLLVGVHSASEDLGQVGQATTRRGALRIGRKAAEARLPVHGVRYAGYNYTITIRHAADGQEIERVQV